MARSNRQLTQFVVNKLRQYLIGGPELFKDEVAGNTQVKFHKCNDKDCHRQVLQIYLFDKRIMELVVNPFKPKVVVGMLIYSGDFYDSKGRPSRTTRERLNGVLDYLGTAGFIPQGVRVFFSEDGTCCFGKGTARKKFDSSKPVVTMLAHPRDLVFS